MVHISIAKIKDDIQKLDAIWSSSLCQFQYFEYKIKKSDTFTLRIVTSFDWIRGAYDVTCTMHLMTNRNQILVQQLITQSLDFERAALTNLELRSRFYGPINIWIHKIIWFGHWTCPTALDGQSITTNCSLFYKQWKISIHQQFARNYFDGLHGPIFI